LKQQLQILFILVLFTLVANAQQNSIAIKSSLNVETDELLIQQEIIFHNTSDSTFTKIYLLNWPNSFRDRKTPLSKRFKEDFRKDLYFANKNELGFSSIKNISVNFQNTSFLELKNQADILEITLNNPLISGDSIKISSTYSVKIPDAKFTGYGKTKKGYHLRFWHLTPAVFDGEWQLISNLNTDDLYQKATDYTIEIEVPKEYFVESNLYQSEVRKEKNNYYLIGKNKIDIILSINKNKQLKTFKTTDLAVHTDVINKELNDNLTSDILNRELAFIKKYLGKGYSL